MRICFAFDFDHDAGLPLTIIKADRIALWTRQIVGKPAGCWPPSGRRIDDELDEILILSRKVFLILLAPIAPRPIALIVRAQPWLILLDQTRQHGHSVDRDLVAPDDLADNFSLFVENLILVVDSQRDGARRNARVVVFQI